MSKADCLDVGMLQAECARLRERVEEVTRQYKQAQDQAHCFIAQTPGYWGRGETVPQAIANLLKAGSGTQLAPLSISCFVGDAEARITQGGMLVEFEPGTKQIAIGTFKNIAAYCRAQRKARDLERETR